MEKTGHDNAGLRIDKWLWAVRLFKTRSQSAEACKKGRVFIEGQAVKPSRQVKEDDIVKLRRPPVVYSYRVKRLVEKRQPASQVPAYLEDITPREEKEKKEHNNLIVFSARDKGKGRPTKKERRIIDRLKDGN